MKNILLTATIGLLLRTGFGNARPASNNPIHDQIDEIPDGWMKLGRAHPNSTLDLRIGLKQGNVADAEKLMNEISDPASGSYRSFLTPQQVAKLFLPSNQAIEETVNWLIHSKIDSRKIKPSGGRNWIHVRTSVAAAEQLLETTYYYYKNVHEGSHITACESYRIPASIGRHIDLITSTIEFDTRHVQSTTPFAQDNELSTKGYNLRQGFNSESLGNCSEVTTPACLRALYHIPPKGEAVPGNSFGIVEFSPQSYNQSDLNGFFSTYTTNVPNDTSPLVRKIDGGYLSDDDTIGTRGESNLDLCYAMGLVYPQNVTLFQTGDGSVANPPTNNNFLDAIDGSYCTFRGGDDPAWDAIYPHDSPYLNHEWNHPPQCGTESPTHVISFSYGSNEIDRPDAYRRRECTEYMKLAMMGVSVLFSAGDTGVSGLRGVCTASDGLPTGPAASTGSFIPTFPASCPWVTAVGGTALPKNGSVFDREVVAYEFNPGGGFSTKFALPSWQKHAVDKYYARHDPGYDSSRYNNSQRVRGYPDISLMSQNYITGLSGGFRAFSGTSASAPTLGAMITLINGKRIRLGKSPVGFLNPVFYRFPELFNDVTEGHNSGCGTKGFEAVDGWDPVSGLGTPDFVRLEAVLLALP